MYRPRIIPVLLLRDEGLVKTTRFGGGRYIGDPINAVRIFNDLRVDEIILLDIDASRESRSIPVNLIKEIGEEADMPFSVGGGIKNVKTIERLIKAGAERVIINSFAIENPKFISQAAGYFGSSTICVCIDYKKNLFGKRVVYTKSGQFRVGKSVETAALEMQNAGAGELIIQSIDNDGLMKGYDIEMILKISKSVKIPVVALGGAGSISDIKDGYQLAYANGLAAGSFFVFEGKHRGVLIHYPKIEEYKFSSSPKL